MTSLFMTYVYFSALVLAVAVILYVTSVNDEISQRKKPAGSDEPQFEYSYGWAFYCAGGALVFSIMASVANISAYLKRYSKVCLEDKPEMTGLGSQNPTTIF